MENIIFQDEDFAIVEVEEHKKGKYVRYLPSEGKFSVVVPFKKTMGKFVYLAKRELVLGWDNHPDLCSISLPVKYQPEVSAVHALKELTGVEFNQKALIHLGVCAASKRADDTFYLFSMDLSHFEGELDDSLIWVDEKTLVEALDAQLVTAVARLKYIV
ncbi:MULTISPECIES: hypothetical protein [unclassified Fusibacter]|uniref:hypothetical protein n=1 Tax=unclassified Fusibacter TaxID=2624464 RepID=UPI0010107B11|nr:MULTISPECIES: hypothetical protein [unclassified Fusibacter]MCK8060607.1 hypothetical protein [Fusibacter sp. A2]NPE22939.1 hypothetical protein [Fusibacter sp. A1]RXV60006.1 hypothetical protein DWB64_13930 [Fusibacter sp. A1]